MAQIIASVLARSREQVLHLAAKAAMAGADWLELRLDRWPASEDLGQLLPLVRLPVLVACRAPEDGGQFRGTLGERRELMSAAVAAGAQGIDLEQWEAWSPPPGRLRLRMRSFHSFTGVPKELPAIRERLLAPGTVAKLAVTAHDLADAQPVLDLLLRTDQRTQPTVAFAMGRTAWPTRVLAAALDAPFVYGSVEQGEETAPGQIPVVLLAGLYRVHELSRATTWYGVLGNPASTSLGPFLHNRAFRRLGLDAVYLPFETSRPEEVVAMLQRGRLRGLSVTAPFKERAARLCHRLGDDAAKLGVTNTLVSENADRLVGHNTDVRGVRGALEGAGVGAGDGRQAVVLGTGGAARAAVHALVGMGFRVRMLGRSLDPAREFARRHEVELGSLAANVLQECAPAVVVNATPVGGLGRDPDERPVPGWLPAAGTVVLDMVYRPRMTALLRDAAANGAVAVPGLEMFLSQALAQLRLFTGRDVPVAALRGFLAGAG